MISVEMGRLRSISHLLASVFVQIERIHDGSDASADVPVHPSGHLVRSASGFSQKTRLTSMFTLRKNTRLRNAESLFIFYGKPKVTVLILINCEVALLWVNTYNELHINST
jgi:hypothetical protein